MSRDIKWKTKRKPRANAATQYRVEYLQHPGLPCWTVCATLFNSLADARAYADQIMAGNGAATRTRIYKRSFDEENWTEVKA